MQQIDLCNVEHSLEDCTRQQDNFLRTANSYHARGNYKYTRSVQCIVLMIAGGRIPLVKEMKTDEYGLRSMKEIDSADSKMSS